MAKYLKEHLGVEPYQYKRDYWNNPKFAALRKAIIDNTNSILFYSEDFSKTLKAMQE